MIKSSIRKIVLFSAYLLSIFLTFMLCKEKPNLFTLGFFFSCTPITTHSIVEEYWDDGNPRIQVEYNGDAAVRISEFYSGSSSKLEIHNCDGNYGGFWRNGDQIPPDIARRELDIQTLEHRYELTQDAEILANLNELKKEAILYWETTHWEERGEQYARDIYAYYKSLKGEETVAHLREVMYPMGYGRFDAFVGDEAYLTYPNELSRLTREQVIVKTDPNGEISKVYWYDDKGSLRRIHLPLDSLTLFISEYGLDGSYALMSGTSTSAIYGGTFDDFNTTYRGGSGWSDISVGYGYLEEVIKTTETAINHLEEIIRKYEIQIGTNLTEAQFDQPINSEHPLMIVEEMNLAYLLDGHGKRLVFKPTTPPDFQVSSLTLAQDQQVIDKYDQDVAESHKETNTQAWRSIVTCALGGIGLLVVTTITFFIVRSKSKSKLP